MSENKERKKRADQPSSDEPTCPWCAVPVATRIEDNTFTYGLGEKAVELHVQLPIRHCDACDLDFLDHVGERIRHETICRHHGVLSPWEIRAIRERRKLSRAAFAKITGLGEATIKRWETAGVFQNTANDRYLRLLATPQGWAALQQIANGGGQSSSVAAPATSSPTKRTSSASLSVSTARP